MTLPEKQLIDEHLVRETIELNELESDEFALAGLYDALDQEQEF